MGVGLDEMKIFVHSKNRAYVKQLKLTLLNCNCQEALTIFGDGCLGSSNDEGRSEVR
jgi:hypothetical protein